MVGDRDGEIGPSLLPRIVRIAVYPGTQIKIDWIVASLGGVFVLVVCIVIIAVVFTIAERFKPQADDMRTPEQRQADRENALRELKRSRIRRTGRSGGAVRVQ